MSYKQYDKIKSELDALRSLYKTDKNNKTAKKILIENNETNAQQSDTIPYTKQDELLNSIMETCKTQFGADFSKIQSPMLYLPKGEDVQLNGEIPLMGDAKFQFSYKENNGCKIWVEPLLLNDETLDKIRLILGVYKNWKKEILQYGDYKPMSANNNQLQSYTLQPGDDAEMSTQQ